MAADRRGGTRLAAGIGGPLSTRRIRASQRVGSAAAIHAACASLIAEGVRPTIVKTCAAGYGFSETTLNRKSYKPILHAAQARFDALESGDPESDDPFAAMGRDIAAGRWCPADVADDTFDGGLTDRIGDPTRPKTPTEESDAAIARLHREIQRRDGQLYHALGVARSRGDAIRRQRHVIAALRAEVETLSATPLPSRPPRDWSDEDD